MLTEDELREMAASIAEHGQYVPCRMTPDGLGLDGRNRVAACAVAEVEPRWEVYDGDPIAFVVEVNAERRHLSTGQRAMATAIGLVEAGARENGKFAYGSVPKDERTGPRAFSDAVTRAGLVLDHASKLADQVLRGEVALDAAYKQATENRDRTTRLAELDEQLAGLVQAGVIDLDDAEARLRDEARIAELPEDLGLRVLAGGLALDEAETIATEREQRLDAWAEQVRRAITVLAGLAGHPLPAGLENRLDANEQTTLGLLLAGVPNEE